MKADGGALLYIILAVVSIIVSVINQNKKKKVGIPVPPPSSDMDEGKPLPQGTWQEELEDIFGKVLNKPEKTEEVITSGDIESQKASEPEIIYSRAVIDSRDTDGGLTGTSEGERTTITGQSVIGTIYSYEDAEPLNECVLEPLVLEGFELRKAIIYNEIMSRKYF